MWIWGGFVAGILVTTGFSSILFVGAVTLCPWFVRELCDSATPMHWEKKRKGQVRNVDGNWKSSNCVFLSHSSLTPSSLHLALAASPGCCPFATQWLPENSSFHQASSLPSLKSLRKICSFPGYHGSLQQSCFLVFFSLKTISKYRIYNKKSHLFWEQRDKWWIWLS